MFDFPNAPTVGQVVTGPNNVQYQWDGVKWITISPVTGGPFLPLTGGNLTGPTTAPTPTAGDNSTNLATTAFVDLAIASGASSVTISDTAPASPKTGNLWFDSVGLQTYIWYTDPTSSQWTLIINQGKVLTEAPQDGNTYGRMNATWSAVLPATGGTVNGNLAVSGNLTAPTPAAGNSSTEVATTAFVAPVAQAAYGDIGRNFIHNPLFNIQQRGAGTWTESGGSGGIYTADRWFVGWANTTGITGQVYTGSDAIRSQIGDENVEYVFDLVWTGTSGVGDYLVFGQRLEDTRRLSGKTVTVSFWANASAALKMGVSFYYNLGTGGSPSAGPTTNGQVVTLATTWARYSVTVALPSLIGLTLGTNVGTDYLELEFWLTAGSNYSGRSGNIGVQSGQVNFWGVQLEIGSLATPLAKRDPADDLRLCQRFYQTYVPPMLRGVGTGGGTAASRMGMMLPVQMRATPTGTLISPLPVFIGSGGVTTITALNIAYNTPQSIEYDCTTAAALPGTAGADVPVVVYASAGGQIGLSADL